MDGLVIDKSGRLYGTSLYGGNDWGLGAVFEVQLVNGQWQDSVIHSFEATNDGQSSYAPLALDSQGRLYGTTFESVVNGVGGAGVVFQLTRTKSNVWQETILHQFGVDPGDGGNPYSGVVLDSAGSIYGTTWYGGASAAGVVFKITLPAATTTTLGSSPNPSTLGEAVTFTATVTSTVGTPHGEAVSFMKGTTVLGTKTLSGGSASFTTSSLPAGTNSITAVYGGDSKFGQSTSKVLKQVVDKATTTTTLTSSQNPSDVGQSVTLTATVTPQYNGVPTGTVSFSDGTTLLKTVAVNKGAAKYTTKTLTSGTHTITATYNGSTDFTGGSDSLTQTVN